MNKAHKNSIQDFKAKVAAAWLPLFRRYLAPGAGGVSLAELSRSALAALVALAFTALMASMVWRDPVMPLLVTPIAASTIILFALPHSPLGQPWPFVLGNLLSAAIGLWMSALVAWCFPHLSAAPWVAGVLAVPGAILAMGVLRCIHPPAGAQALLFALSGQAWLKSGGLWPLLPLTLNLFCMLLIALWLNNILHGRSYPVRGAKPAESAPVIPALARAGIQHQDLRAAMDSMDTLLDVSEQDLVELYQRANRHAFDRRYQLTVGDIMSTAVQAVEFATPLAEAWEILRKKEVKALPVVDRARRVVGVITRMDFLHHCEQVNLAEVGAGLALLLARHRAERDQTPAVVGQIMSPKVFVVEETAPVTQLLAQLTHGGRHHVPVVNSKRRLVGMVTQADLLAALYQHLALSPQEGRAIL